MISDLIVSQICADSDITCLLAEYNNKPAIFYQKAPNDSDPLWNDSCFPHIVYNIYMKKEPERTINGKLIFNICCSEESNLRDIEAILIDRISGTFYSPLQSNKFSFCAAWSFSKSFAHLKHFKIIQATGLWDLTLSFDIMGFPEQITTQPDPILALNALTKQLYPETLLIGYDSLPQVYKPKIPAIYWRMKDYQNTKTDSSVAGFDCQIAGHIIFDDYALCVAWCKELSEELSLEPLVVLGDGSQLLIQKIAVNNSADNIKEGQLVLSAYFSVIRKNYALKTLNQAGFQKEKDSNMKWSVAKNV